MSETWIDAGAADRIALEDVAPFEHERRQYALYRTADDRYFATDGVCTHEYAELADGFVMGTIIEVQLWTEGNRRREDPHG
jgi:3-phenylpropionate/trans-cinnamate dioxygenase ferredoxin component